MKKEIQLDSIRNFIKSDLDPKSMVERKQFSSTIAIDPNDERTVIAKITTIDQDRDGDIIIPQGVDFKEYEKNPLVCFNHSYSILPIGKMLALQATPNALYGKMKIADTEFANEIWSLLSGGFINACSIGFTIKKALIKGTKEFSNYVKEKGLQISDKVNRIITECIMIENSIVPLPCNPEALMIAISNKSIHLDGKLLKDLGMDNIEIKDAANDKTDKTQPEPRHETNKTDKEEKTEKTENKVEIKVNEQEVNSNNGDGGKDNEQLSSVTSITPTIGTESKPVETQAVTTTEKKDEVNKIAEVVDTVIDKVVEEVKEVIEVIEKIEDKIEEQIEEWTVVRDGDYKLTECDKETIKSIKLGKVL